MSKVIYKYPISPASPFKLPLPKEAEFLDVQVQHGTPVMWWVVDPESPKEDRVFSVLATGFDVVRDGRRYLGTFQVNGGDLVFHLFEIVS